MLTAANIILALLMLLVSSLLTMLLRRAGRIEEALKLKVDRKEFKETMEACANLHQKAYFEPITSTLSELAQTIKYDREEFWRAINSHSHEGLDKDARVVRNV